MEWPPVGVIDDDAAAIRAPETGPHRRHLRPGAQTKPPLLTVGKPVSHRAELGHAFKPPGHACQPVVDPPLDPPAAGEIRKPQVRPPIALTAATPA